MNSKTVLLCYDDKEKALATELKECIEEIFNDKNTNRVNVELCGNPSHSMNESGWKKPLDKAFKSEKPLIFVLCSPFSIRQPWINFISGVVTIKIEVDKGKEEKIDPKEVRINFFNRLRGIAKALISFVVSLSNHERNQLVQHLPNKTPAIIIPICHSGQKAKDLPHYLLSRQAMEVQHPLFAKKLASTLSRRLGIDEPPEENYSRFLSEDFIIKIASVFETYSGDKLRDENTESKAYIPIRLVKNGDKTIRIKFLSNPTTVEAFDEDKWLKKIEQMNDFLFKDKVCESPVGLAIGIQNCLFDGKSIYVGLMMKAKSNTDFLSSSNGEFDTGYTVLRPPNKLSEVCFKENFNLYKPSANQFVTKEGCPDIFNLMSDRLMTLGAKPWPIKLPNGTQEYIATIFVNNSRLLPRFEIGIWKYIDISHIATEPDKKFIEQDFAEVNDLEYWIWVKDGEICYWSFSDEKHIPRHISPAHQEEKKSVLLNTAYLKDTYGRLEKYTPFVSDEDLINSSIDMVNGRFSASASALLACF